MTSIFKIIPGKENDLEVMIHPHKNGIIVINYAGFDEDIDGNLYGREDWKRGIYSGVKTNKYVKIADFIQSRGVGTVIRAGNLYEKTMPYPDFMNNKLESIIDYSLSHSFELSGEKFPQIYLMGFSAGASSIAMLSTYSPLIKKILLIAPSTDANNWEEEEEGKRKVKKKDTCFDKISRYKGELYITMGENDKHIDPNIAKYFYKIAKKAKPRKIKEIPDCGHFFEGGKNGKILSQAPLWAFAGDKTYPNPKRGIKLYD